MIDTDIDKHFADVGLDLLSAVLNAMYELCVGSANKRITNIKCFICKC